MLVSGRVNLQHRRTPAFLPPTQGGYEKIFSVLTLTQALRGMSGEVFWDELLPLKSLPNGGLGGRDFPKGTDMEVGW